MPVGSSNGKRSPGRGQYKLAYWSEDSRTFRQSNCSLSQGQRRRGVEGEIDVNVDVEAAVDIVFYANVNVDVANDVCVFLALSRTFLFG